MFELFSVSKLPQAHGSVYPGKRYREGVSIVKSFDDPNPKAANKNTPQAEDLPVIYSILSGATIISVNIYVNKT